MKVYRGKYNFLADIDGFVYAVSSNGAEPNGVCHLLGTRDEVDLAGLAEVVDHQLPDGAARAIQRILATMRDERPVSIGLPDGAWRHVADLPLSDIADMFLQKVATRFKWGKVEVDFCSLVDVTDFLNRIESSRVDVPRAAVALAYGIEHGIEWVDLGGGRECAYVNRGDTYDETLLWESGRGWYVSSWGDEVEAAEMARTEDTGERRQE